MWKGVVIEEGLQEPQVLWETQLLKIRVTPDGQHAQTVFCEKETIEKIQQKLKPGFCAHFWEKKAIIAAFPEKLFEFEQDDPKARKKAAAFGKKNGVPEEQLEFLTD